ncbi:class I SAM-dependent methyltransferase [uncultured Alsobacter sp.]|uniref:class I SAM-dependent methyltransferase n=1 Tax=uncultured Alsobacter sp. TaxID=1748258 RepID=UPI0025E09E6C|nr:class I SAM-dependent methyltransferase [uncultured Alsobacter sp.]
MSQTRLDRVREARRTLAAEGPNWVRSEGDFGVVTLPVEDCDAIRDAMAAERPATVVEIGLAYGSSALAIGEALVATGGRRHVIVDPYQESAFRDAGWTAVRGAGLEGISELLRQPSQNALPRLIEEGVVADAAFVDGSHVFHQVFVDVYFLQTLVKPGGLVILDDHWWPGVALASAYFETVMGWTAEPISGTPGRLRALRLPATPATPDFKVLPPFWRDGDLGGHLSVSRS